MLRMQNVIYEKGSGARQTAARASPGAGLGRRARSGVLSAKGELFPWPAEGDETCGLPDGVGGVF